MWRVRDWWDGAQRGYRAVGEVGPCRTAAMATAGSPGNGRAVRWVAGARPCFCSGAGAQVVVDRLDDAGAHFGGLDDGVYRADFDGALDGVDFVEFGGYLA